MNKLWVQAAVLTAGCWVLSSALASALAGTTKQLDAHEHGSGALNVVIDGGRIALELEAPGKDIAGFEHAAASEADKQTVAQALATLEDGVAQFSFPAAGRCTLASARAELESEKGTDHNQFHVTYAFDCASIADATPVTVGLFQTFPSLEALNATVVSAGGQSAQRLTRDAAVLALRSAP